MACSALFRGRECRLYFWRVVAYSFGQDVWAVRAGGGPDHTPAYRSLQNDTKQTTSRTPVGGQALPGCQDDGPSNPIESNTIPQQPRYPRVPPSTRQHPHDPQHPQYPPVLASTPTTPSTPSTLSHSLWASRVVKVSASGTQISGGWSVSTAGGDPFIGLGVTDAFGVVLFPFVWSSVRPPGTRIEE